MEAPAHVRHHGRGELVLAPFEGSAAVLQAFNDAGVPTRLDDNVQGALWAKLVLNCAWNGLSAITRMPYGQLLQGAGVEAVLRDLCDETLAVARACGVQVPGDPWQATLDIGRSMASQLSSTARDLMRGHPSEIEHLNGVVVRQGETHGIPTPANRMVLTLVRLLESQLESRGGHPTENPPEKAGS
jgi:2-dehydropantoate 2-reductase